MRTMLPESFPIYNKKNREAATRTEKISNFILSNRTQGTNGYSAMTRPATHIIFRESGPKTPIGQLKTVKRQPLAQKGIYEEVV